jgi:hypothetical protein
MVINDLCCDVVGVCVGVGGVDTVLSRDLKKIFLLIYWSIGCSTIPAAPSIGLFELAK